MKEYRLLLVIGLGVFSFFFGLVVGTDMGAKSPVVVNTKPKFELQIIGDRRPDGSAAFTTIKCDSFFMPCPQMCDFWCDGQKNVVMSGGSIIPSSIKN